MILFVRFMLLPLIVGYAWYADQVEMAMSIVIAYLLGLAFVRFVLHPKTSIPYLLYELFFVIYGFLVLLSHIELIHDPFVDYFVHNDASQSFYENIMNGPVYADWHRLIDETLLSPYYDEYPLASLLFATLAKIGMWLGIVNIRLFLRIHVFMLAALVVAVMARLLESYGIDRRKIQQFLVPFGLFSYLYLLSACFTRDIHVCLVYSLMAYACLIRNIQYRALWFLLLTLLATGFRPENGILAVMYIIGYYFQPLYKRIGPFVYLVLVAILIGFISSEMFLSLTESLEAYNKRTIEVNQGDGLFMMVYSFPFPLNQLCIVVYQFLLPLPLTFYMVNEGGSLLTLPFIFSPYLMCLILGVIFVYLKQFFKADIKISLFMILSFIMFCAITYGEPGIRRSFAVIPGLYMAYCLVRPCVSISTIRQIKFIGWPLIACINIFFLLYLY